MPMFQNPMPRRPAYGVAGPSAAPAAPAPSGGLFSGIDQFRQQNPGVLAQFGASLMARSPAAPGMAQAAQMMQVNQQKNATAKYLLDKGLADTPEEAATLASNPALMQTLFKDNLIQDQFEARKKIAESMGLDPNDAQTRDYMLSGQFAGGGTSVATMTPQQRLVLGQSMGLKGPELTRYSLTGSMDSAASRGLNSTELKLKAAAEDKLPGLDYTAGILDKAAELLPNVATGTGTGLLSRTEVGLGGWGMAPGLMDPKVAQDTKQFNDLMTEQGISAMSATLKGATTEKEMDYFLKLFADERNPIEVRKTALERLRKLVAQEKQTAQLRIKSLSDAEDGTVPADPSGAMPGGAPAPSDGVVDYRDWQGTN